MLVSLGTELNLLLKAFLFVYAIFISSYFLMFAKLYIVCYYIVFFH